VTFTITNLVQSREYKFFVTAYNLNGAGLQSDDYYFFSCISPSKFAAPFRQTSTETSITIKWTPP